MTGQKAPRGGLHPLAGWGLALAGAGAPLIYSNSFIARFTLPKLFILALGMLLALLGLALSPKPRLALPRGVALSLLACVAALGLSTAFSQDRLLSLLGRYDSYAYGVWPWALLAALFLLTSALDEPGRERITTICLSAGALVGVLGALQSAGFEVLPGITQLPGGRRAVSTLGSPVDLGAYLGALLPLALTRARAGGQRALGWLFLLSICAGLLATLSRGAWLGAAAGAAAYLALEDPARLKERGFKLLGALLLAALVGAAALRLSGRPMADSDAQRPLVWRTAWALFLEHPLLGTGPDTFEQDFRKHREERYVRLMGSERFQAYAHNDLLQALATTGLAGTLAYLALLLSLGLAAARTLAASQDRTRTAAACGGLACLFVILKFDPVALEVLVTSAVLAGLILPPPGEDDGLLLPPLALALLVLAFAVSFAGAWCFSRADLFAQEAKAKAAAGALEEASALLKKGMGLNSCELSYRILFVNQLGDRVNAAQPALRRGLLSEAEALAGARCHSSDVNEHYIRGIVNLMQAQVGLAGKLPMAAGELDAALERDPYFLPLLRSRFETAQRMGDRTGMEAFSSRIRSLEPSGGGAS